ncbi:hypothetical protein [Leptolyngbya sp. FACHB-261]|uniref:hypothetical protein n=1 Tax=Leptolyngbya sp. FACHB-261 TaxID=2692806 RepID=UPI001682AC54|nr:hypothetical protein [Leptolyngbya sp. FACHB-261]MBD2102320.1 hypothetical protein [Leptolyngbya sp. FACHB-261]
MSEKQVVEADLNFDPFNCCGNEALYPFKCSQCGWPMVFCYECDTLYNNLHDLSQNDQEINHFKPDHPGFSCPKCNYKFEYYFMQNPLYWVSIKDWVDAGFEHLLRKNST